MPSRGDSTVAIVGRAGVGSVLAAGHCSGTAVRHSRKLSNQATTASSSRATAAGRTKRGSTKSRSLRARPRNSSTPSTRFWNSTASRPDCPSSTEVKRKLTSRDEVVSYLTKHLNDEDTKRLRRSELVLKKFGLLPRDFNLETFLVALLREEVAGYYDPKTKTVNLLDWVPMEEQEPVMAHELHPRSAGSGRRSAEVDEARRKGSGRDQERSHAAATSKTTRSTTRARPSSKARRRP